MLSAPGEQRLPDADHLLALSQAWARDPDLYRELRKKTGSYFRINATSGNRYLAILGLRKLEPAALIAQALSLTGFGPCLLLEVPTQGRMRQRAHYRYGSQLGVSTETNSKAAAAS